MSVISRVRRVGERQRYLVDSTSGRLVVDLLGFRYDGREPDPTIHVKVAFSSEWQEFARLDPKRVQQDWLSFWAYVSEHKPNAVRPPQVYMTASVFIGFIAVGCLSFNMFLHAVEPLGEQSVVFMQFDLAAPKPHKVELNRATVTVFSDESHPFTNGQQWGLLDKKRSLIPVAKTMDSASPQTLV